MAGYEIPISLSLAASSGATQDVAAPTIFNFGSGDAHGGWFEQMAKTLTPATATSATAKNGNATAVSEGTGATDAASGEMGSFRGIQLTPAMIAGGFAAVALVVVVAVIAAKKL